MKAYNAFPAVIVARQYSALGFPVVGSQVRTVEVASQQEQEQAVRELEQAGWTVDAIHSAAPLL